LTVAFLRIAFAMESSSVAASPSSPTTWRELRLGGCYRGGQTRSRAHPDNHSRRRTRDGPDHPSHAWR
jgi:hypothetical protein